MITFSRECEKLMQDLKKASPETYYHSIRVKKLTLDMLRYVNAQQNRFSQDEIDAICKGALLHDIGKLFVRNFILTKDSKLTEDEAEAMSLHTAHGSSALEKRLSEEEAEMILSICLNHHERIGPGKGDENSVPLYVQIVSVCDAYDALVSDRVYRVGYPKETALAMIEGGECGRFSAYMLECLKAITEKLEH